MFGDDARLLPRELERARVRGGRASTSTFVQDNHSRSRRGVLRGLHYQIEHAQGKLVRVVAGEVFDVAVDLRRSSPTFGRSVGDDAVGAEPADAVDAAGLRARLPACCPSTRNSSTRRPTTGIPEHERTLLWNDPALGIAWPLAGAPILDGEGRGGHAARGGRRLRYASSATDAAARRSS